jgi:splicing factor 45
LYETAILTCTEAALRFQPSKRPPQQQKAKPKGLPKPAPQPVTSSPDKEAKSAKSPAPPVQKSTLADWTAEDPLDNFYGGGPRAPRGGRKKRKKNKDQEVIPQNWDDIYDPTRPNKYEEYKDSDERMNEIMDWRDRLYAHRKGRRSDSAAYPSETESYKERGPSLDRMFGAGNSRLNANCLLGKFAPPSALSFAPPASYNESAVESGSYSPDYVPDDPTGEDAYMRRMRLSGVATGKSPQKSPQPSPPPPPRIQPPSFVQPTQTPTFVQSTQAPSFVPSQQPQAFQQPSSSADDTSSSYIPSMQAPSFWQPPQTTTSSSSQLPTQPLASPPEPQRAPTYNSGAVISAAPVRYNLPAPPANLPANEEELEAAILQDEDEEMADVEEAQEEEAPRSKAPGQKGFAERLMKKYGWSKGQGLGSEGTGITTALAVKVEKRKKKPDAKGGKFVGPSGMGKIVGGKKKKGQDDGPGMSPVVICRHMLDGMDLDFEMGPEGNIVEEIGKECEKNVSCIMFPIPNECMC